jgi:hypothetical protein
MVRDLGGGEEGGRLRHLYNPNAIKIFPFPLARSLSWQTCVLHNLLLLGDSMLLINDCRTHFGNDALYITNDIRYVICERRMFVPSSALVPPNILSRKLI